MKKLLKSFEKFQKGASLIEILLYFALFSIILAISIDFLIKTGEFGLETSRKDVLQEEGRYIIGRLTYDIHRANPLSEPDMLGETTNLLRFTVVTGFFSSEVHEYTLDSGNLLFTRISTSTNTANLNSNRVKVNSLSFTRLGSILGKPTIKIAFELETTQAEKGGPKKQSFETVVGTR